MIIRCDNCSVSLQLDESKIPSGNFSVRCPRCQNLLRVQKDASGKGLSTVEQLAATKAAAATDVADCRTARGERSMPSTVSTKSSG